MIALLASAPALPLGTAGKFVAAAYIVAFVIVLTYVAIMAVRAQRVERELERLRREVEAAGAEPAAAGPAGAAETAPPAQDPERSGSPL